MVSLNADIFFAMTILTEKSVSVLRWLFTHRRQICLYLLLSSLVHSIVNYSSRLVWRTRKELFRYRELSTSKRYLCFQESEIIIQSIITFHAFTRCDTTSAFWRKGKVRPLHLMLKNPEFMMTFAGSGNNWEIDKILLLSKIEVFVCAMYGCTSCNSVNKLRYASIPQF